MKKFTALFALAAIALLVASPAAAFNTSVTNVLDSSWVGAFAKWKLKVNMTTFNDAAVTTYVDSKSETGDNKIESNDDMENTTITTGDADAASLSDTTANTNSLEEDLNGSEDGDTTIDNVDDDSSVIVKVEDENEEDVNTTNFATVNDDVDADSDTGDNKLESDDSLTNGHIATGKAMTAAGGVKLLNSTIKTILRR
jgi:hypothetical protein